MVWNDDGTWVATRGDEWAGPQPDRTHTEDMAEWGAATGRYASDQIPFWRQQLNTERSRILASGQATGGPTPVEKLIASLYPALAPGMSALSGQHDVEADDGGNLARRVLAKAGLDQNGQPVRAGAAQSGTPLIDAIERDVYGPTREELHRQQDLRCEAEVREQVRRDALRAAAGLDEREWDVLFPPARSPDE